MADRLETLLEQFKQVTTVLKDQIDNYQITSDDSSEEWLTLLDRRQQVIDEMDKLLKQGIRFTDEQRQNYLLPALKMDEEVMPLIERHKRDVQAELGDMKKKKIVSQQYNGYGVPEAYGAFFDKKK